MQARQNLIWPHLFTARDENYKLLNSDNKKMQKYTLILIFFSLAWPGTISAAREQDTSDTALAASIDSYLMPLAEEGKFSGAVLLAQDGQVELARGYGYANHEHRIQNTPDTKFRIGSLTKQFTAVLLLALDEQGELSTDDYISKHLPDAPEHWEGIKIAHLLSHTSGIPNFTGFADNLRYERLPTTVEQTVARFADKELNFEPGSRFEYSNSGYVLLGYIAELVANKSYEDLVSEIILKKAGMEDTGYDHPSTILSKRAAGYSKTGDTLVNAIHFEMDTPHAAGALYSTVYDLFKWDQALRSGDIISKASIEKMETPYFGSYGFGVDTDEGQVFHSGTISGFKAFMRRYPQSGTSVIVLSNYQFSDPGEISLDLAKILLTAEES
ncbi:serine hydrolase domain-containing protein [Microbulbifer yueqingensis]|uniref:CubicO group peptidase, beta-lactamase class C family n=1 Tax=Microbulbifer yueqingensis TaxID=658219 RepID=A0A1G8VAP6_9GAMM|nr:serine hydrolase domain-containing protein [Microbulbifer yueqingensis]SDJ62240.1 CubicO group peptidase, beta-lactamase class C family [Microbulbifer yueqingensis]